MFTSHHLTELRQGAAARRGWLALLALAFALTLLVCSLALGRWAPRDNQRLQAVAALDAETRALIVGSSHVFASINPALLGPRTMNLAAPVCSYVCIEGVLRGNLHRVPGLRALVIEYDVVPALYDTLRAYSGDHRALLDLDPDLDVLSSSSWQWYELWRDRTLERSFLGPLLRFEKLNPEQVMHLLREGPAREDELVAPGFANGNGTMPANDDGPARAARHVREAPGLSALPRNEAALRRILQLGRAQRWKLALVRLPHHPGYWAALPPAWQQAMAGLLRRLRSDFPGAFEYWDLGELSELSDADFRNGDHINAAAVPRVTALVGQHLERLLESPGEPPTER